MNTIKLNTLGDKVIVRKAAENGGNAGGDNGGSGGSNIEYYDISGDKYIIDTLATIITHLKISGVVAGVAVLARSIGGSTFPDAMGIDRTAKMSAIQGQVQYSGYAWDLILSNNPNIDERLSNLPRLTEEQFYNLES